VGSVARVMANMGLEDLVLVEPAPPIGGVARGFGVGGWHVLDRVRRFPSLAEAVAPARRVVGTSALRRRALGRSRLLTPRELAAELVRDPRETPVALVFGPEDKGLRRDELELCGLVVRVPSDPEHPTLNLAQAVLVVAYELFVSTLEPAREDERRTEAPATSAELEGFLRASSRVLEAAGFDQPHIHRSLVADVRRLAGRSGASSHEIRVLWRVANRLLQRLATE
jgi:TrmH family RNA methyltransferase